MTAPDPVDTPLLTRLSEAAAPSGEERAVALILRQEFEALGLAVSVDRIGNLSARVPGRPTSPGCSRQSGSRSMTSWTHWPVRCRPSATRSGRGAIWR